MYSHNSHMPNITLSVSEKLHKEMKKFKLIKWSEVAREAIRQKLEEIQKMERILKKSRLTMKDVLEIDKKVKKGLRDKYYR